MNEPAPKKNGTVLLIEDDPALAELITQTLTEADYTVLTVSSSKQAFVTIFKSPPNIIILDINLPDLDGFHIAKELKRNMMLRHIPVIVLSSRIDFLDKMRSLDVIMDEYLVKPIDPKDLLLRTQLVAQRAQVNLDANPLTRLPGNMEIVKTIKAKINTGKPYAVGYADLNNFKAYNDKYGFSNGDLVIQFAAKTIVDAVHKLSPQDNFVGHVGGDDFVFVCGYETATEICQFITDKFDKEAVKFYNDEDREKGYVVVEDRRGVISQFPLISIAVGMVSDEGAKFSNLGQINHSLTQLKKYAKSFHGSAYVRDRRSLTAQMAEFTWGPGSATESNQVLDKITSQLGAYLPGQLTDIIKKETLTVLFQPILDMRSDEVAGQEGLVRGPANTPLEYPDALFQTARTSNQVLDLDMLCMKKILAASEELHNGVKLFVNVFPETVLEETRLKKIIQEVKQARRVDLIFELSGSNRANDADNLFSTLAHFKEQGLKICVDAAIALQDESLRFLLDLRPNYVKLNMVAYKDMLNDYQKQGNFMKTINLIRQAGSEIICTKLESRSDSYMAMKSGVTLGQGFLFARPSQTPHKIKKS